MYHYTAREVEWRPLYRDAEEALRLWFLLTRHLPGALALCVMPNHVHGLHPSPDPSSFQAALRAYSRYRNTRRSQLGRVVWAPFDAPQPIARGKVRIQVRYVHLNPCRAKLVGDPLAWPLSTHLDAVGLAPHPVRSAERSPRSFHSYVSGDPSVSTDGTALPGPGYGLLHPERVADVVAGLYRVSRSSLCRRGRARTVMLGSARALTGWSVPQLAAWAGVTERTVFRAPGTDDARVRRVIGVAHDERFGSIEELASRSTRCEPWA